MLLRRRDLRESPAPQLEMVNLSWQLVAEDLARIEVNIAVG